MATLGDPLIDLGIFALYWDISRLAGRCRCAASAVTPAAGFPTSDELLDALRRARRAVPVPTWTGTSRSPRTSWR